MSSRVTWLARPARYLDVWQAMRAFTAARQVDTPDEVWLCEHEPVYTLGQAALRAHILDPGAIEVVQSDRGGQVTYHGPGQVVAYGLVDLRRAGLYVRSYVTLLEDAVIATLADAGIQGACRLAGAPGIYIPQPDGALAKIAALGMKIRNGCAYHGVALNVDMDLRPYLGIHPCGMAEMRTLDMRTCLREPVDLVASGERLSAHIVSRLQACSLSRS